MIGPVGAMHTPPQGCICAHVLAARTQACADQIVGLVTIVEDQSLSATVDHLLKHYGKLAAILQEAIDAFTNFDGCPDPAMDADAVAWLLKALQA